MGDANGRRTNGLQKGLNITPCTILAGSEISRGSIVDEDDEDDGPNISDDGWIIAD